MKSVADAYLKGQAWARELQSGRPFADVKYGVMATELRAGSEEHRAFMRGALEGVRWVEKQFQKGRGMPTGTRLVKA